MNMRSLLEKRSATVGEMRALADSPEGDGGDLSEDQAKRFDALKGELAAIEKRVERQQALDDAERRISAPAIISGNGRDGSYEQRAREFSLIRAINSQLGDPVDAGLEREISAEVRSRSGRSFQGIATPDEYFVTERRTLTIDQGSSPQGAAFSLYPQIHRPDLFVDLLRSALVVGRLGATVLDGLVGDNDIPKQTASSTAEWLAEEGALTPSDADFTDVSLTPHTVGSITSYSRRTLINARPSVEQIVRRDLASVIARAIDSAALFGSGLSNQPLGVVNETDVAELTLAAPSWQQVLAFPATIQGADADLGSLGWVMSPASVAKLRSTNRVSGEPEHGFLQTEPGSLAGYGVATTTAMPTAGSPPTTTVVFGAWSQLLVGYWSGLDVLVNPYESTAYHRGRVLIRAMRDVDVATRHGESFAYADDLPVG